MTGRLVVLSGLIAKAIRTPLGLLFSMLLLNTASYGVEIMPVGAALASKLAQQYGTDALGRIDNWQNLIRRNQSATDLEKLALVNRFFNRIHFVEDQAHWQTSDYWATPVELLASNGGDCEDFAIAKYFTLRAMGIAVERLKLTYVKAIKINRAHMVLTFTPVGEQVPLVLDNLSDRIVSATQRTDLEPIYSFNAEGLWLAKQRGKTERLGDGNDVTMWRELRLRIVSENVVAQD